ncbi:hypothetical protein [Streptomyces capitiformicae]|uniref:Uncharacterized protein n=1 Tax=Streptomyces capitiformicae TaxID=2014920 RepID=A0A919DBD0_9ACTN|nr:hypothetical protein [Streptomyces capitiformicae]GHE34468.1 hypothetical protein GCM10017771_52100 [Streptomyces capitiformicae]
MGRTLQSAAALVAAAVLLTGCGGDSETTGTRADGDKASASASETPKAEPGKVTHEVTLQVGGEGTAQVMYHAATDGFDTQTLPWTKTETVELTDAHQAVGYLVSVIPGSVKGADGLLQPAPCVIKVDGKQVADNDDGKSAEGCSYTIK